MSVLGITTATLIHTALAAVGLSAILASSATAFTVVKLAGSAYLLWLAARTWLDRSTEDFDVPSESAFHPVSQTEDDVLLYLRAMAAAAAADGHVDEAERNRIIRGLRDSGIDPQASDWLEQEFASPADVDELAAQARSPEKAAQVYAAARIAIDPDTLQEREFLNRLAEALDLDQAIRSHLDDTTSSAKA